MTDNNITPPPELVQQWNTEGRHQDYCTLTESIAARAAQWGADQKLEACCEWLFTEDYDVAPVRLRAARRPKPPRLKRQALEALKRQQADTWCEEMDADLEIIGRALEALPND